MLQKIRESILDTLFPITCFGCQKNDFWLCVECERRIQIQNHQLCPKCEKENTLSGFLCPTCRLDKNFHLDALISAATYKDPVIKKLIYCFKYRFVRELSDILSKIMSKALALHDIPLPAAIVPVPLHMRRLRWRGFNQAELLARQISLDLAPMLPIPVLDILARRKYNKPQMEIRSYQERLANVKELFVIKPDFDPDQIKKRTVLLIDDVATTGATLEECAKVLKENGAKKVFAAVIARQAIKYK